MSKKGRDDDVNGCGGNSNDDGDVDGNDVFNTKDGYEVDDGGEQTESVASDLAECKGSSKMEIRAGVMQ